MTSTASAAPLWVLAQRAIWLRLFPTGETCWVSSRSTSGRAGRPRPRAGHGSAYQRRERHTGGRGLGPPVGGLARREADGDDDRAAPSHQAMPTRGERGRRPRPRVPPECGSVGVEGAESLASPTVIPGVGWLSRLNGQIHPSMRENLGCRNRHTVQSKDGFWLCQPRRKRRRPTCSNVRPGAGSDFANGTSNAAREGGSDGTPSQRRGSPFSIGESLLLLSMRAGRASRGGCRARG